VCEARPRDPIFPRLASNRVGCRPVMPVAIVSDTCHYLPPEPVLSPEIHEVSLYVPRPGRERARTHVIDSETAGGGRGLILRAAAAAARAGGDGQAVRERALRAR